MRAWIILLIFFAQSVMAADVNLAWDTSAGATDYRIEMSTDLGATWGSPQLSGGMATHLFTGVPEDGLILFRVAALTSTQEAVNQFAGAWYDHRNKLASPGGAGIPHSTP